MTDSTIDRPEVATTAGRVRGRWRDDSAAFLGIPFAEPPVGALRFAAPAPHRPWEGVLDAGEHGATPQRKALAEITLIPEPSYPGESTLNVDVFTPRPGDTDAKLPVLVYIHGGGYVAGSPASPWYDGAPFNRAGIVTVNVSYRLGFDGFGWIEDAPANRAVLDWILALEWVRDNIAAFGGDPAQVTIAGQSAGGGAVLTLLTVPRAASLFQRVYSISGTTGSVTLADAERYGRALAAAAGVEPTRAGLSTLTEERILALQGEHDAVTSPEAPADPLAPLRALASGSALRWAPVVDGDLVPAPIGEAVADGVGADKALVLGATDNEFNMAVADLRETLAHADAAGLLRAVGVPEEVADAYAAAHADLDTAGTLGQFVTDAMFRAPARAIAESRAAADAPAWLYRFAWTSPTFGAAVHCLDVPFFFDCLDSERVGYIAGEQPPASLAADVHAAAVRFVLTGDPGWPAYALPERDVQVFDLPTRVVADGVADVGALQHTR
ncbi:carboxylesterase/lipase family protein [Leifsonia sp. EB34]|uniref:carboxylesterase/lipase family protein n=1 Tax=Leifsonia sp. EB34 TaxID=3156303 RepID=UPI0035118EBC